MFIIEHLSIKLMFKKTFIKVIHLKKSMIINKHLSIKMFL